ncbi:MAG: YcxB family protein [Desulfobacteraceae bacterium]|jgi:hypothetical protein
MQIRYRNTLNQLVALQKYMLRNSAFGRKMMLHRFIMVECILAFICFVFAINHNRLVVLMCFAGLSGLAWLFRERAVIVQFKKDFRRERRKDEINLFDRDRIMTIDTDGFRVLIGSQENRYGWNEVEAVGQDKNNIYILLAGILHYVIPKSAWEDRDQSEQFFDTLQSYRNP